MESTFLVFNVFSRLKWHWDQNFGIPYFYIFEKSLWFLVTEPTVQQLFSDGFCRVFTVAITGPCSGSWLAH